MRIGTTPTHTFTLPIDIASVASKVRIVYSQGKNVVLTKDVTELENNCAVVKLTQTDTLKFHCRKLIEIQVRVLTKDGNALTSNVISRNPCECLEREVLV